MRALPFFLNSLLGWIVAHLLSSFDRDESAINGWMRISQYPVGIAGASVGTWMSQNIPSLYNKVFVVGIFFSGIAVVLFQAVRRFWMSRQPKDLMRKGAMN
jgi:uncharacterized membrane protein YfcA